MDFYAKLVLSVAAIACGIYLTWRNSTALRPGRGQDILGALLVVAGLIGMFVAAAVG